MCLSTHWRQTGAARHKPGREIKQAAARRNNSRAWLAGLGLGLLATVFWASLYVVTRLLFGNFTVDPVN